MVAGVNINVKPNGRSMFNLLSFILGLSSGFAILLSGNTLNFWLTTEKIDIKVLGFFAMVTVPYAINFIWSPIFDRIKIGRLFEAFFAKYTILRDELSWYILLQAMCGLMLCIIANIVNIPNNMLFFAICATIIAMITSSCDAVLGSIRTKMSQYSEDFAKITAGYYVFGYRIGMIISGSLAIYLSEYIGWSLIYCLAGFITILIGIVVVKLMEYVSREVKAYDENVVEENIVVQSSIFAHIVHVLRAEIFGVHKKQFILYAMLFLVLYRLADNIMSNVLNPFLMGLGISIANIAWAGKLCGTVGSIVGGLLGGQILRRSKIRHCLLLFGILHAVTHISYILINLKINSDSAHNIIFTLSIVTLIESVTGGMVMAAYMAFITSLCYGKYSATQYALFSSMMGVSRSIIPSIAGVLVSALHWNYFFIVMTLLIIPSVIILNMMKEYDR